MRRKLSKGYPFPDCAVFIENAFPKPVETESAPAFPVHGFRYAALFALNDLPEPGNTVCQRMFSHFYADVAAAHLVGNRRRRARTEKGIQHQIAGVRGHMQNALDQAFRLWGIKSISPPKKSLDFFFRLLCMSYF